MPSTAFQGNRLAALKYYRKRRKAFQSAGLNTRGRPYRRTPPIADPVQRVAHRRKMWRAKARRRTERRNSLGLNSRGRPFTRATETAPLRMRVLLDQFARGQTAIAACLR